MAEVSDFEFDVTSFNEVTVGESIDFNFNIKELSGQSNFEINYAVTGVNGEIRNGDNNLINANTKYDVDNTFKWNLKGVNSGIMNITFNVKNQYGVEKSKTISINVKPIDFDFNVIPIGSNFDLGDPISFAFTMDAPSSLTYELSFTSNTGGNVNVNFNTVNQNIYTPILDKNFNLTYNSDNSGTSIVNFKIRASNGVEKTKQVSLIINQDPVVTNVEFRRGSNCGTKSFTSEVKVYWNKPFNVSISSVTIKAITADQKEIILSLDKSDNDTGFITYKCLSDFFKGKTYPVEIKIKDNRGVTSEVFVKNITF